MFATRTDEVITIVDVSDGYAGVTGPDAFGQPEWALNGTVSYDRESWGSRCRRATSTAACTTSIWIDPSEPGYNPTRGDEALMVNDNTIDSWTWATLAGRYRLPMSNERSWELFVTMNNALDEDPPLAPDGAYPTKPRSSTRSAARSASVSAATSAALPIS